MEICIGERQIMI